MPDYHIIVINNETKAGLEHLTNSPFPPSTITPTPDGQWAIKIDDALLAKLAKLALPGETPGDVVKKMIARRLHLEGGHRYAGIR